jgi:ADP-ribosyl-[dinitrogen reductase] hydrolase
MDPLDVASRNRELLEALFQGERIDIRRGMLFDRAPASMSPDLDFGRVEGMMLGLAIGDALGNTSESQPPSLRRDRFGEIRDYLPNRYTGYQPDGLPSDDSQLAFWTLEQMLADSGFEPEHVAHRFCRGRIFGIGSSVRQFRDNMASGVPWHQAGPKSAGNGALMRIAPMLIPHLRPGTADLWMDTALSAMITHNDSASIAACLAFVDMLWQMLQMPAPPQPEWWLESYVAVASDLEQDENYRSRAPGHESYQGALWRFVQEQVSAAHARRLPTVGACNSWYSGAYLLETIPSVIYILMRHGDDPEEAIVRAVNDTWDNDTIAAIVGAAVGALHGRAGLPARWIEGLLGRTAEHDDGHVFQLVAAARTAWWSASEGGTV